ncbi:MAG: heavy metal-binding domain-containing protein [Saprospiraceae bacterium]|jgi:hypothetical protein|nr:heavy metal-binding domain-containing protein [Saprospiraceae bacterium]
MKYLKVLFLSLAFLAVGIAFTSCGNGTDNTEKQGKEYTSAYVCPMHCEGSGSDAEGKCPVCGMDYVKKEKHTADGHTH